MEQLIYPIIVLLCAGFIQGLAGFGSGLIAVPALALVLPLTQIVPMMVIAGTLISIINLIHLRHAIELSPLKQLLIGFVLGTPIGLIALTHAPQGLLILGLGLFLSAYALISLNPQCKTEAIDRRLRQHRYGLGAIAGALGAAFSTSGPPIILHVSAQQNWSSDQKKALLSAFFLITTFITLSALALNGRVTPNVLKSAALAAPALILGSLLGIRLYTRLSEHNYQRLTYLLILTMGLILITRSLS